MMLLLKTFVGEQRTQQLLAYFNDAQQALINTSNKEDVASREFIDYVERALTGVLGAATSRSLVEAALRDRVLSRY